MLRIVVVDQSAEARGSLTRLVTSAFETSDAELTLLPQISLKSLTFDELRFHGAADIVILGPELVQRDLTLIGSVHKLLPATPLVVRVPDTLTKLTIIEQVARFGADDIWLPTVTAGEVLRKIIILSRRSRVTKSGKLIIIDSGKGGIGVTSLTAALGESLALHGKKTVLIDCDVDSQNLTRFLQVRPCINENLQQLVDGQRPLTQEGVEQCVSQVWGDFPNLFCLAPVLDAEKLMAGTGASVRLFLSVLEILDSLYDCVVVDVGVARGALLRTLYRVADSVIFPVGSDPATLFVASDRIARATSHIAPDAEMKVVYLNTDGGNLKPKVVHEELLRATRLQGSQLAVVTVPYDASARRWPASGTTLYGCGGRALKKSIDQLLAAFGLLGSVPPRNKTLKLLTAPIPKELATATQSLALVPFEPKQSQPVVLDVNDIILPLELEPACSAKEADVIHG